MAGRFAVVLLCAAAAAGCQSSRGQKSTLTPAKGSAFVSATPASFAAARLEAMAAADTYATLTMLAYRMAVKRWVFESGLRQ